MPRAPISTIDANTAARGAADAAGTSNVARFMLNPADDNGNEVRSRLGKYMLAALLGGGAVGAGVTGISGMRNMMRKPKPPNAESEVEMALPYPQKMAAADTAPFDVGSWRWLKGDHAKHLLDNPMTVPGVLGAGAAGTFGMSALMENLIKRKRKSMLNRDLQEAQQGFQQSMMNQYKQSSADPLDRLYDQLEKKAIDPSIPSGSFADDSKVLQRGKTWAPTALGTAATASAVLATLAARGAYKNREGRTQEDLLQKAIKHREYLNSMRSPKPISFIPQAVEANENQLDVK